MQISVSSTLTLYHDGQFWVGIAEHVENGKLCVARVVFGAEPSDEEIFEFVVNRWERLVLLRQQRARQAKGRQEPQAPHARSGEGFEQARYEHEGTASPLRTT